MQPQLDGPRQPKLRPSITHRRPAILFPCCFLCLTARRKYNKSLFLTRNKSFGVSVFLFRECYPVDDEGRACRAATPLLPRATHA
jgi:hypothetical protein